MHDDENFFDVTIACDDKQLSAHKLIISACRPRPAPTALPDLQSVLNFMYHSEVNISQEVLNTFIAVAEDLKVKGLAQTQS